MPTIRLRDTRWIVLLLMFLPACSGRMQQPAPPGAPAADPGQPTGTTPVPTQMPLPTKTQIPIPALAPSPERLLPVNIGATGWARDPELQRFGGDSLFDYIDGAAEAYHKYHFVEVHVAQYRKGGSEIVADLYAFADADRAYGMYTTLRPDDPDTVAVGIEGFLLWTNLIFVKGSYIVNLATYDDSESVVAALSQIASAIGGGLPGTTEKPALFALFPRRGRLAHTERIFAESYLGLGFLTDVYTVDFARGDETFTLFLLEDPSGDKLNRWWESAAKTGMKADAADLFGLPFDGRKALSVLDSYHGRIIAGPKSGHLVGAVGYRSEDRDFLVDWLNTLP